MSSGHFDHQRGMRFTCDQDWDAMRPTANGRHCAQCDQAVVDFTRWDRQAMLDHLRMNPGTCGLYTAEQVEPHHVPIADLSGGLLRGAFTALAALALHTTHAQTQTPAPAPTEQLPVQRHVTQEEAGQQDEIEEKCWMEKPVKEAAPVRQHSRSKLYVSKRFPFVHKRRPRRMGYF
jgi:hypothetical protein